MCRKREKRQNNQREQSSHQCPSRTIGRSTKLKTQSNNALGLFFLNAGMTRLELATT